MDSRYRPTVPQRKKIQSLEDELLRGPLVGAFAGDDDAEAAGGGDSAGEEMHDGGAADTPAAAAVAVKAEGGGVVERKSGGFARADAQSDARLRAIAEQVPAPPRPNSSSYSDGLLRVGCYDEPEPGVD
jgi:hypothetical protein